MIYALVGACVWVVAGPSHWVETNAKCGGRSQSPINIEPSNAEYKDIGSLVLSGYDVADGHGFRLENNGHTGIYCITFLSSRRRCPRTASSSTSISTSVIDCVDVAK